MAHTATMTQSGSMAHRDDEAEIQGRSVEADPGPWLVLLGPLTLLLTVVAVSWLSMTSF